MNAKVCAAKHRKSRYFYCQRRTQIPQEDIYYRIFKKDLEELATASLQDSIVDGCSQSMPSTVKGDAKKSISRHCRVI